MTLPTQGRNSSRPITGTRHSVEQSTRVITHIVADHQISLSTNTLASGVVEKPHALKDQQQQTRSRKTEGASHSEEQPKRDDET